MGLSVTKPHPTGTGEGMIMADFDKCADLALVLTRKLVSEFELDQRGLDEVAVYNVVLKGIVEYEKVASMQPTPLERFMSGPDAINPELDKIL